MPSHETKTAVKRASVSITTLIRHMIDNDMFNVDDIQELVNLVKSYAKIELTTAEKDKITSSLKSVAMGLALEVISSTMNRTPVPTELPSLN
jgi:hypothetical protein